MEDHNWAKDPDSFGIAHWLGNGCGGRHCRVASGKDDVGGGHWEMVEGLFPGCGSLVEQMDIAVGDTGAYDAGVDHGNSSLGGHFLVKNIFAMVTPYHADEGLKIAVFHCDADLNCMILWHEMSE